MKPYSFVVIADSHIRSESEANPTYPSDRTANTRHAYAMRKIRQIAPAFLIHLGDVVHPIPALASHGSALKTTRKHYDSLKCLFCVVLGNHDVGDKPTPGCPPPMPIPTAMTASKPLGTNPGVLLITMTIDF
jgi:metallophosphoesterase superfamily enzyme